MGGEGEYKYLRGLVGSAKDILSPDGDMVVAAMLNRVLVSISLSCG
jgi:hypothetical protein